jgi:O-antigen/teichoic acid export membrane protein
VLVLLLVAVLGRPHPILNRVFAAQVAAVSYPLMINNLLATLFFRVDGLILRAVSGDTILGWYGMAYKFVDALNIVPSSITLALFPILSRMAGDRRGTSVDAAPRESTGENRSDRLLDTTTLACKALLTLALPVAVGTTLLAEPLVRIVGGDDYLPHSAIALQVLIWFVPVSFINGLLQYVLIALNRQTLITRTFVVATLFNVVANLLLVPHWSYLAAATITILSELVLLAPFWFAIRQLVGPLPLLALALRPTIAALVMAVPVWLLREPATLLAVPIGACAYTVTLLALGGVSRDERTLMRAALAQLTGRPRGAGSAAG